MGLRVVRKGNQNNNSLWLVKNDMKLKSAHKRSDWNVVRRSLPWQCPQRPCVCGQKGAGPCPGHRWMCPPCPAPPCVPIGAPHPPLLLGTCVRPVSLSFCAAGPRRLPAESLRSPALAWEGALARPPLNVLWSRESGWTGVSVHGLGAGPGCCRATGGRKCLSSVLRPLRPFSLGDPPPFLTFLSSRCVLSSRGPLPAGVPGRRGRGWAKRAPDLPCLGGRAAAVLSKSLFGPSRSHRVSEARLLCGPWTGRLWRSRTPRACWARLAPAEACRVPSPPGKPPGGPPSLCSCRPILPALCGLLLASQTPRGRGDARSGGRLPAGGSEGSRARRRATVWGWQ